MLHSQGQSRGKVYHLPGATPVSPEQVFAPGLVPVGASSSALKVATSALKVASSALNDPSFAPSAPPLSESGEPGTGSEAGSPRDADGCLISKLLDAPIVDNLAVLSPALQQELEARARLPRQQQRLNPETMMEVILSVCRGRYLRLNVLAELVQRNPNSLRQKYLDQLVKTHRIRRAFPGTPTHEMQSYRTEDNE